MGKLIIRILIAIFVALLFAAMGVKGNAVVVQTLFTVLVIVFSISMSLLVSFGLSKVLNKGIRIRLRTSIYSTRNLLLIDFAISTLVLVIALIWNTDNQIYSFGMIRFDIMLIAVSCIAMSLVYEIYNFRKIHNLHTDIEDAIIEETAKTKK